MKKLSKVQIKQQAAVMSAVEALEQKAFAELPDVEQCWFSMEHNAFPGSLLVRVQFNNQQAVDEANAQLTLWQKRLSALLLKKGILIKNMRNHLVFTQLGPDD
ncbi:hypothetical protein DS2_18865 [Catenovulum agarivorans DS-2]|uniref:Orphan protein n=1 Tax=Catenovulum agarivorans DS-2 TaxID=1328313 RepID=W7Q847_9ALTE|nr:hypothetical protein [Catenovulum agarivorans]EWH08146.1 hypothetical protein DS2_18865 [Catenovulum agarivorans DS-2]